MSDPAAADCWAIEPCAEGSEANCCCFALSFGSVGGSTHCFAAVAASFDWRSPGPSPDYADDLITWCWLAGW